MRRFIDGFIKTKSAVMNVILAIIAIPIMVMFYIAVIALTLLAVCSPIILIVWMILQAI